MAPRTRPPFRADHVGSLLRPPALLRARADRAAGTISADQLTRARDCQRLQQEAVDGREERGVVVAGAAQVAERSAGYCGVGKGEQGRRFGEIECDGAGRSGKVRVRRVDVRRDGNLVGGGRAQPGSVGCRRICRALRAADCGKTR